jgi:hypothetical protein
VVRDREIRGTDVCEQVVDTGEDRGPAFEDLVLKALHLCLQEDLIRGDASTCEARTAHVERRLVADVAELCERVVEPAAVREARNLVRVEAVVFGEYLPRLHDAGRRVDQGPARRPSS